MRIALLHFTYPPVVGGVENVVAAHASLFARAGHDVSVLCREGASMAPGISIVPLPAAPDLAPQLCDLLRDQQIVLAHNVCTMPFDLALTEAVWAAAQILTTTRFVCWVHDLAPCNPDYSPSADPRWNLLRRANDRFHYVAVSAHRAQQLRELNGVAAEVIPNGIDPAETLALTAPIAALANEHDLFTREIVLLHPTRLLLRKRVEFSIRLLAALKESGCRATLLVTGAGDPHHRPSADYAAVIHRLVQELALDRETVFLHPTLAPDSEDLASLYRLADAVLFPSRDEGFGIPLLEAALHRLPIFCSDAPAHHSLRLPGQMFFALDADEREVARAVASGVRECALTQARKSVARDFAWGVIYDRFLAPLLNNIEAVHAHETNID